MERRGLDLPLLIGGATTSKQHTAVRIAPAYSQPTVHVLDASRVVALRLQPARPGRASATSTARTASSRSACASSTPNATASRCSRSRPRARTRTGSRSTTCPPPPFTGGAPVEPELETLAPFVDWQFFFHAWELKGKFPAILERPEARELYDDALALLEEITIERALTARGVYGFWPARSRTATTSSSTTGRASASCASSPTTATRGRTAASPTTSRRAATRSARSRSGSTAPTSWPPLYEAEHDDYRAIMVKALADRLAEAFAEWLHAEARRDWYAPGEELSSEELVGERYRGIRPGVRLPGLSGPQREGEALRAARRGRGGARADRDVRDDPGGERQRRLLRTPGGAVLLGRPDRPRPGRGLRRSEGHRARRGRALAAAESRRTSPRSCR